MTHKFLLLVVALSIVVQLGLTGFSYFSDITRSAGSYIAKKPDGSSFEMNWIDRPNVSTRALLSWATLAATATFTIDFVNYEKNLNDLRDYFTINGYDNFLNALTSAGILSAIQDKKLVVTAVPTGPAIISSEDEVGGYHTWQVEVPVTVSYLSASAEDKSNKVISILITQVPTTEAPKGLGIGKYVVYDLGANI